MNSLCATFVCTGHNTGHKVSSFYDFENSIFRLWVCITVHCLVWFLHGTCKLQFWILKIEKLGNIVSKKIRDSYFFRVCPPVKTLTRKRKLLPRKQKFLSYSGMLERCESKRGDWVFVEGALLYPRVIESVCNCIVCIACSMCNITWRFTISATGT